MAYKVGDKIKFTEEKRAYTIRACNDRYLICTKPFNPKHTVLYTIVDLQEGIRGRDFWIFGIYEYKDEMECWRCLNDLKAGVCEISRRNRIKLNIEKHYGL